MGIIVFTADDAKYRVGDYITMYGEMAYPPTTPDTTYILHTTRFKEKDALSWATIVPYRLVIVTSKLPTLTSKSEDIIVIDASLAKKKDNWRMPAEAILRWRDRERAYSQAQKIPIPLALAFLRANNVSIDVWRLLADITYTLPDEYIRGVFGYAIQPQQARVAWPKKSIKKTPLLDGVRESDIYTEQIIELSRLVANEVRVKNPSCLPKRVKKRKEGGVEWL